MPIFLYALLMAVVFFPLWFYIRQPQYWRQPIMEHNIFRQLLNDGQYLLARTTAILGLFTAFTVLLAGSGLYLPVAGKILCHFATLFVAAATAMTIRGGVLSLLASTLLLLWLAAKQAPVLLLADGPLGLIIGWGIATGQSRWRVILLASFVLAGGAALLSSLLGIPVFAGLTQGVESVYVPLALVIYGIIYSWAWVVVIAEFLQGLQRILARP